MLKRISDRFRVDLGEMENDYRVFYLKDDITYSTVYMVIAILGVLSMFRSESLLYPDRPELNLWMVLFRGGYIVVSLLIIVAIRKTSKVKV